MVFLSARSLARVSGRVGSPCVERRAARRVLLGKRWRTSTRWLKGRPARWRCRQAASRLGGRRQRGVLEHHRGAQRELCAGAVGGIAWLGCHAAGGDRVCGRGRGSGVGLRQKCNARTGSGGEAIAGRAGKYGDGQQQCGKRCDRRSNTAGGVPVLSAARARAEISVGDGEGSQSLVCGVGQACQVCAGLASEASHLVGISAQKSPQGGFARLISADPALKEVAPLGFEPRSYRL